MLRRTRSRRWVISVLAASTAGAGCTAFGRDFTRPDPYTCGSDLQPYSRDVDRVVTSEAHGLDLQSERDTYEMGETLRVSITNVSDELIDTGTLSKYFIQRHEGDEWVDLHYKEKLDFSTVAHPFPPGHSETYTFEISNDGIDRTHHRLCTEIRPGNYRFVFFGISTPAIATEFEIVVRD